MSLTSPSLTTGYYAPNDKFYTRDLDRSGERYRLTNPQANKLVWGKGELKSIEAVTKMAIENGAKMFDNLESIARFLNGFTTG